MEAFLFKPESREPLQVTLPEKDDDHVRLVTFAVMPNGEVAFCQSAITTSIYKQADDSLDPTMMELSAKTLGKLIRNKLNASN